MAIRSLSAHDVPRAFVTAPGGVVELSSETTADTDIQSTTTYQRITPTSGSHSFTPLSSGPHEVSLSFMYGVFSFNAAHNIKFKIEFDDGVNPVIVLGDTDKSWRHRVDAAKSYSEMTLIGVVDLVAATTYSVVAYATQESSDSTQFLIPRSDTDGRKPIITIKGFGGSGAGGEILEQDVLTSAFATVSNHTVYQDTGLEITFNAPNNGCVDIILQLSGRRSTGSGSGTLQTRLLLDGSTITVSGQNVSDLNALASLENAANNLSRTLNVCNLTPGSHTVKLQFKSNNNNEVQLDAGSLMTVRQAFGGLIEYRDSDDVLVTATPIYTRHIGAELEVQSDGGLEISVNPNAAMLLGKPDTANSNDLEFESASELSSWSRSYTVSGSPVDPYAAFGSGDCRELLENSQLFLQPPANGSVHYIHKAITVPTNLLMHVRLTAGHRLGSASNNDVTIGIMISETDTGLPDLQNSMRLYIQELDASTVSLQVTEVVASSSSNIEGPNFADEGTPYDSLAIHKVGGTYHFWAFSDSGHKLYLGNFNGAITPDRVSVFFLNTSTADPGNMIMGLDFIRFVESATAFPTGGRIR